MTITMRAYPNLRHLAYLVALAEHRHFGKAAEASAVTQSTLSAGIRELETMLGIQVAERTKRLFEANQKLQTEIAQREARGPWAWATCTVEAR